MVAAYDKWRFSDFGLNCDFFVSVVNRLSSYTWLLLWVRTSQTTTAFPGFGRTPNGWRPAHATSWSVFHRGPIIHSLLSIALFWISGTHLLGNHIQVRVYNIYSSVIVLLFSPSFILDIIQLFHAVFSDDFKTLVPCWTVTWTLSGCTL